MRFLVATSNRNKFLELETVAKQFGIELVHPLRLKEEKQLPPLPDVVEDLPDYRGNALKKAMSYSNWSGLPAIGDDSGLEVEALQGRPGVLSARYAPTDQEKIAKLVGELKIARESSGTNNRRAQFRCVLVCVNGQRLIAESEGVLPGEILDEPQGLGGFGYDPIVLIDGWGKTLAEVDFAVTCSRGFRARAAQQLFARLAEQSISSC